MFGLVAILNIDGKEVDNEGCLRRVDEVLSFNKLCRLWKNYMKT